MLSRYFIFLCVGFLVPLVALADSASGHLDIDLSDSSKYVKAGSYDDYDLYFLKPSIRSDARQAAGTKGLSVFMIRDYKNKFIQYTIQDIDGSIKKHEIFYNRAVSDTSINCLSKEFTDRNTAYLRDEKIIFEQSFGGYHWNKTLLGKPHRKAIDLACSFGSNYL